MPALPSSVLEPLWVQVSALLPTRQVHHPLGCYRQRVPDRIVFDLDPGAGVELPQVQAAHVRRWVAQMQTMKRLLRSLA